MWRKDNSFAFCFGKMSLQLQWRMVWIPQSSGSLNELIGKFLPQNLICKIERMITPTTKSSCTDGMG